MIWDKLMRSSLHSLYSSLIKTIFPIFCINQQHPHLLNISHRERRLLSTSCMGYQPYFYHSSDCRFTIYSNNHNGKIDFCKPFYLHFLKNMVKTSFVSCPFQFKYIQKCYEVQLKSINALVYALRQACVLDLGMLFKTEKSCRSET